MNIAVEYIDQSRTAHNQTHRLTRLAFAKHLAVVGQVYVPKPKKLIRTLAMFFHYSYYIQRQAFYNDRFSEPSIQLSDPTEKGQFSNLSSFVLADSFVLRNPPKHKPRTVSSKCKPRPNKRQ